MARTIEEIKAAMTASLMRSEDAAKAYGFRTGDRFADRFPRVCPESLLLYIAAAAAHVTESLFDTFRADTEARIAEILPHRPRWYRDKALLFMKDRVLVKDADYYDTSGMKESEIEAARPVRHAAASEPADASMLVLKISGEKDGRREPLDTETLAQFAAYIREIKDAGVRVSIVNEKPDSLSCRVTVWYDPVLLPEDVKAACTAAVTDYLMNLPFNGEYSNMALIDRLQTVEGVRVAELASAKARPAKDGSDTVITGRYTPYSGCLEGDDIVFDLIPYDGL